MKTNKVNALLCGLTAGLGLAAFAGERAVIDVGGMSEAKYGVSTVETMHREGLGNLTVLFTRPWTAEKIQQIADFCRAHDMKFTMDELMDRRNNGPMTTYKTNALPPVEGLVKVLKKNADVVDGSLMMCEYGGVMFNWPDSSVAGCNRIMPLVETYGEANDYAINRLKEALADAEALGIPRPYISIEPAPGCCATLLRGGIDRVDVEMIFGSESERRYAMAAGATRAFGKKTFGVDGAAVWYAGERDDTLWMNRWRTSLFHAFLRGANPVYSEHGVMDYRAFGKWFKADAPRVREYRRRLGEFAAWAKAHPRPVGLPRAAVAVIQGRHDGFVGGWQNYLWGQRGNEAFRVGEPDDAWQILDGFYRRRMWEDRDRNGEAEYSGNPPLGAVEVLPYDAPDEIYARYETLILLGRNVMDDALYGRLVRYVAQGGKLLLAACHLDSADRPQQAFKPYKNGDWHELVGLKALPNKTEKMGFGLKFMREPRCGWQFHMYGTGCDPWFTDGGFAMPVFERDGATPLAVESDRFSDKTLEDDRRILLYENRIGKGTVVFVPSLDSPGARTLKSLYTYLCNSALDAVVAWPKVECSDRVRWSVYEDGTIYLLNTEDNLACDAIVRRAPDAQPLTLHLAAGEMKELKP